MDDFTLSTYKELLLELKRNNYRFQTFSEYLTQPAEKVIMLRHDVDKRKENSLEFARIQKQFGIQGSYYFRILPQSFDTGVIRQIAAMGHEIGYHYEDMDLANGDHGKAIALFEKNLDTLRAVARISTICMHGSPRSRFDNRDLWNHYSYKDYGILGEPYYDIDFSKVFYLTDTGRRWDGHKVSVRDKVDQPFELSFRHTSEIIRALRENRFPRQVMFTFHPQRWTNSPFLWWKEKNMQQLKNQAKYYLIRFRQHQSSSR